MPRTDLLSLSTDDLARLSTRGWVNAARKELDDGRVTGQLTETPEGGVAVRWSDGRVSEVPAGSALGAGRCSCNEGRVCKHLVRLVLLYQRQGHTAETAVAPTGPWDPGSISDDELARDCAPKVLARARQLFAAGVLVELVRAVQPVARFHLPVCTVRFLLPHQPAYARCNCARPAPCEHVALAVWAFRQLPAGQRSGIVSAGAVAQAVSATLLDALDTALMDFAEQGVSGAGKSTYRLARLIRQCEAADLVWPGEVLRDLLAQLECYTAHDARFDPGLVASLVGELAIRTDPLRSDTGALPQLLVRGGSGDRPAEIEAGEYWGLGCGVRTRRRGVELAAYLYDRKSGNVGAITHEVPDPAEPGQEGLPCFARLAERSAVYGLTTATFHAVAAGILKLPGGKRTARCELLPGRAQKGRPGPVLLSQEQLAWEEIDPSEWTTLATWKSIFLCCLPPRSGRAVWPRTSTSCASPGWRTFASTMPPRPCRGCWSMSGAAGPDSNIPTPRAAQRESRRCWPGFVGRAGHASSPGRCAAPPRCWWFGRSAWCGRKGAGGRCCSPGSIAARQRATPRPCRRLPRQSTRQPNTWSSSNRIWGNCSCWACCAAAPRRIAGSSERGEARQWALRA
jgi:hypothetical protein